MKRGHANFGAPSRDPLQGSDRRCPLDFACSCIRNRVVTPMLGKVAELLRCCGSSFSEGSREAICVGMKPVGLPKEQLVALIRLTRNDDSGLADCEGAGIASQT